VRNVDKRAQAFSLVQALPRLIFLTIVFFSMVFVVRSYVIDSLNVQQVQAEVFMNRILYAPHGILYFDEPLNTTIPGVIDKKRMTNERLDALFNYSSRSFIAAKIELVDAAGTKIIATAVYNNQTYFRWLPIAQTGIAGPGGIKRFERIIFVTYIDEQSMQRSGTLRMEVLLPGN
jgi:hypothetical protein